MILDISISIIAITIVVLAVFAIIALIRIRRAADGARRDLHHLTTEIVPLVKEVTTLIKEVNGFVHPFKPRQEGLGSNISEWIAVTLAIVSKLRRHYEK